MISRRRFIGQTGTAFAALAMLGCTDRGLTQAPRAVGYGPLLEDSNGLLDLPEGFNYRVLSQLGDLMSDGTQCQIRQTVWAAFRVKMANSL